MVHPALALPQYIPSPPADGFHIWKFLVHYYALGYIIGITFAILITRRRWRALGGDPNVVNDIALWVVPAGIIGGRIYFDITTPQDIPHVWYGPLAVWTGGLGIWGGVLLAAIVGVWRLKRMGLSAGPFANAIAPGLLVAQAIGRVGNYFNNELFGKPTGLPWGLEVPAAFRPPGYVQYGTFQPSFLYELIWDLALAAFLVWLGHHARIRQWGLFALYVAGYSGYRIFEETIRIDSSSHILGLRLNFFVALFGTVAGLAWFAVVQRRPESEAIVAVPEPSDTPDAVNALDAPSEDRAGEAGEADDPESPDEQAAVPAGAETEVSAEAAGAEVAAESEMAPKAAEADTA